MTSWNKFTYPRGNRGINANDPDEVERFLDHLVSWLMHEDSPLAAQDLLKVLAKFKDMHKIINTVHTATCCGTCRFWEKRETTAFGETFGICHRYPPLEGQDGSYLMPRASYMDWCGEHQT